MAAFDPTTLKSRTIEDALVEITFLGTQSEDELAQQDPNYIRKISLANDSANKTVSGGFTLPEKPYLNDEGKLSHDPTEFLPEPAGSGYGG